MKDSIIVTSTGGEIDPLNPNPDDIHIENIARGLSRICRFTGQLKPEREIYTVAQHCIIATRWAMLDTEYVYPFYDKPNGYKAILLHDASEAFLSDLSSPVKHRCRDYLIFENALQNRIFHKFIGVGAWSNVYHKYDKLAFWLEVQHVMPVSKKWARWYSAIPETVPVEVENIVKETWMPYRAYQEFMRLWNELNKEKQNE